jgi:hypothetical protein
MKLQQGKDITELVLAHGDEHEKQKFARFQSDDFEAFSGSLLYHFNHF